jgi:Tfp pilus assembly PilM family ATPase/Tfp pilus assembly protein PilN
LSKVTFKRPVTVVEIGNDWIKIAENSPSVPGRAISKISLAKLAQINESVGAALNRIFKASNYAREGVITYLPRHLVTIRILEFPSTDRKEIDDMVNLQVSKQTPYSKEEIYSSHKVLLSEREGYTKVMLVIARRNIVSERVDALQSAGISVERVAISTEGVANWFSIAYASESASGGVSYTVVLDVDSNYSDFIVMRKSTPVFTRSILIGANQLMGELDKWQEKFLDEIKHSVELFQSEQRGARISKIFLSGAGKNVSELAGLIGPRLGIDTENAVPVKNLRIKDGINVIQDPNFNFVSVSALFGIAMRHKELEIDLTPHDLRIQRRTEEKRRQLVLMGILATSIVMLVSLFLLTSIYVKNAYLKQVKDKVAATETEANDIKGKIGEIKLVEERIDARGTSLSIISELHRITPREVYLLSISMEEKKKVTLKGRANALSDVYKYAKILEDSRLFEKVNTNFATMKRENNMDYADFEIVCTFEKR